MSETIIKQFTFNVPSSFLYDLLFEVDCMFTFSDGQKVLLETHDTSLGENTFQYKDCGNTAKNVLYGWHLCTKMVLAYACGVARVKQPLAQAKFDDNHRG